MYIDYGKLFKLLIDKGLTKTDLLALTGISSRVLAKLAKNETVTTDTIARICTALDCDVGDMMACVPSERLTVSAAYRKRAECVEQGEGYTVSVFTLGDSSYRVYETKQAAGKGTHIHCRENGTLYWEQLYPFGGMSAPSREERVLCKPICSRGETVIVLIKGKPAIITGLDENGFVSAKGIRRSETDIYVMSEAAFKLFSPKEI